MVVWHAYTILIEYKLLLNINDPSTTYGIFVFYIYIRLIVFITDPFSFLSFLFHSRHFHNSNVDYGLEWSTQPVSSRRLVDRCDSLGSCEPHIYFLIESLIYLIKFAIFLYITSHFFAIFQLYVLINWLWNDFWSWANY